MLSKWKDPHPITRRSHARHSDKVEASEVKIHAIEPHLYMIGNP